MDCHMLIINELLALQVAFAAIDCTKYQSVCSAHDVSGYPTFKYFNYGKNAQKYTGGREVKYSSSLKSLDAFV